MGRMMLCTYCKIEKDEAEFSPSQILLKYGICRVCVKNAKATWRKNNSEKNREYSTQYYQSNRDYLLNQTKEYQKDNKEKTIQTKRKYRQKNRSTLLTKRRVYTKNVRKTNTNFRLRGIVSCSIRVALKNNGGSKNGYSCFDYLGYSIQDLKAHLESQFEPWMSWDNQGKYSLKTWDDNDPTTWTWQIDHIVPLSFFSYISMEEKGFRDCWALFNLRPLSSKKNLLKSNKLVLT